MHYLRLIVALCLVLSTTLYGQDGTDWFPYLGLRLGARLIVVEAYPGSSAQKAGLHPGDHLVSIGGTPAASLSHSTLVQKLRGELGTQVVLGIERHSTQFFVTLTHAPLVLVKPGPHLKDIQPDDVDAKLIIVAARDADTPEAYNYVLQGVSCLPRAVKQTFVDSGVTLVLTPTLFQLDGQKGASRYDIQKRQAVICEHADVAAADSDIDARLPITTLHELGHAYDRVLGLFSSTPDYLANYREEAPKVRAQDRSILSHFLQREPMGPRECFASLFACKYFHEPDPRLDALRANFPKTLKVVLDIQE
jgi:hypothetical protein